MLMEFEENEVRFLCKAHADNYMTAGFFVWVISPRRIDTCEICNAKAFGVIIREFDHNRHRRKHGAKV